MKYNNINLKLYQLGCKVRVTFRLSLPKPIFDHDILSLNVAEFSQTLLECLEKLWAHSRRIRKKNSNSRDFPLLLRMDESTSDEKEQYGYPGDLLAHSGTFPAQWIYHKNAYEHTILWINQREVVPLLSRTLFL